MAGVITDLLDRTSDSSTGRPIIATLAAPGKALAATSINIAAATNWTTTTAIHFSIYTTVTIGSTVVKDPTSQTDWKGTLSGTAIGNLTLTGGTDRTYTAGAIVELTPTSRYAKDLYDWAIAGHNQNGTHKAFTESSIVPTAAIQDSAVTAVKIADATLTNAKLSTTAGELGGAWQSWTPTWQVNTIGNSTVTAKYQQVGKTVRFRITLVVGSTSNFGLGQFSFSMPVAPHADLNSTTTDGFTFGVAKLLNPSVLAYPGTLKFTASTSNAVFMAYKTDTTYGSIAPVTALIPFSTGVGSVYMAIGEYEAA